MSLEHFRLHDPSDMFSFILFFVKGLGRVLQLLLRRGTVFQVLLIHFNLQINKVNCVHYFRQIMESLQCLNFISLESKELMVRQNLFHIWPRLEGNCREKNLKIGRKSKIKQALDVEVYESIPSLSGKSHC